MRQTVWNVAVVMPNMLSNNDPWLKGKFTSVIPRFV